MLVVLDTNVLVSALLSPHGPPARTLDLLLMGEVRLVYDDRIMAEYREVLGRPKFGFARADVDDVLLYLEAQGESVIAHPLSVALPDPDDAPFLEVAAETGALLVTGNRDHYPVSARGAVQMLSPSAFLEAWRERR